MFPVVEASLPPTFCLPGGVGEAAEVELVIERPAATAEARQESLVVDLGAAAVSEADRDAVVIGYRGGLLDLEHYLSMDADSVLGYVIHEHGTFVLGFLSAILVGTEGQSGPNLWVVADRAALATNYRGRPLEHEPRANLSASCRVLQPGLPLPLYGPTPPGAWWRRARGVQ